MTGSQKRKNKGGKSGRQDPRSSWKETYGTGQCPPILSWHTQTRRHKKEKHEQRSNGSAGKKNLGSSGVCRWQNRRGKGGTDEEDVARTANEH